MKVTGSSNTGFTDAFEDAVRQAPRKGNVPVKYAIQSSWLDDGGIAGLVYNVDVEVTGPVDVAGGNPPVDE